VKDITYGESLKAQEALWEKMDLNQKAKYLNQEEKDKKRYDGQLAELKLNGFFMEGGKSSKAKDAENAMNENKRLST
jgi:hypothetical protein